MYIFLDNIKNFSCRMCGTCCRNDWMVTVDEGSYNKNAEWFAHKGDLDEFKQAFRRLEGNAGLGEFAYIAKKKTGECWFLGADNLCRLHLAAGHSQLDKVCQTYPRYPMVTARGLEVTLSFSCPAVLDLVGNCEPLAFVRSQEQPCVINDGSEVVAVFPRQRPLYTPLFYYFELEQHFIDIIQWRGRPITARLQLLRETLAWFAGLTADENSGGRITEMFNANYAVMDKAGQREEPTSLTGEILAEHFLVNLVFKKIFYVYGLSQSIQLLEAVWRQVETAAGRDAADLAVTRRTIMALELEYSHNKKALFERFAKESSVRARRNL